MKVAVFGALGRMGREVTSAIELAPDLELVAKLDSTDDFSLADNAEVIVDFTHPEAVMKNLEWAIAEGKHAVVGTTGFTSERIAQLTKLLQNRPEVGVLIAPNFSIGAIMMMHCAKLCAPYFDSVEIMELHHPNKADAPSGTATLTAEKISQARAAANCSAIPDATVVASAGARGTEISGIKVHSLRIQGMVAHQEVLFGAIGETLSIRHDSLDRKCFMPGVLLGCREIAKYPGITIGLEKILGIE